MTKKRKLQSWFSEASVKAISFLRLVGFWRTPALVQFPPSFVRGFYFAAFNEGRERKGRHSVAAGSPPATGVTRVGGTTSPDPIAAAPLTPSSGPALRGSGAGPSAICPLPTWRPGRRVPLAGSRCSGAVHFGSGVTVSSSPPSSFSSRRYCRRRRDAGPRAAGPEPACATPSSLGWGRGLAP